MKLFDSHVHLADDRLYPEWEVIVQRAMNEGVEQFLVIATEPREMERALLMKQQFPKNIRVAASITPHDAHTSPKDATDTIEKAARAGLLDAIGETGLEFSTF